MTHITPDPHHPPQRDPPTFTDGMILGLLIGEGHFGGDQKQAHVNIKMHIRHKPLLQWVAEMIPGSKLYGPYNHVNRQYYQLMIRGQPLRIHLIPFLDRLPLADIDPHVYRRYCRMKERYQLP